MDRPDTVRTFIAAELPADILGEVSRVLELLRSDHRGIKWVRPGSVHLTFKFLGDVDKDRVSVFVSSLSAALHGVGPFEAVLDGLGVFPGWRDPRVIWIGMGAGSDKAISLASKVDEAMTGHGFAREEREFKPHFTLGRVKDKRAAGDLRRAVENIKVRPCKGIIDKVVLFRSILGPCGATYEPLGHIFLGTS